MHGWNVIEKEYHGGEVIILWGGVPEPPAWTEWRYWSNRWYILWDYTNWELIVHRNDTREEVILADKNLWAVNVWDGWDIYMYGSTTPWESSQWGTYQEEYWDLHQTIMLNTWYHISTIQEWCDLWRIWTYIRFCEDSRTSNILTMQSWNPMTENGVAITTLLDELCEYLFIKTTFASWEPRPWMPYNYLVSENIGVTQTARIAWDYYLYITNSSQGWYVDYTTCYVRPFKWQFVESQISYDSMVWYWYKWYVMQKDNDFLVVRNWTWTNSRARERYITPIVENTVQDRNLWASAVGWTWDTYKWGSQSSVWSENEENWYFEQTISNNTWYHIPEYNEWKNVLDILDNQTLTLLSIPINQYSNLWLKEQSDLSNSYSVSLSNGAIGTTSNTSSRYIRMFKWAFVSPLWQNEEWLFGWLYWTIIRKTDTNDIYVEEATQNSYATIQDRDIWAASYWATTEQRYRRGSTSTSWSAKEEDWELWNQSIAPSWTFIPTVPEIDTFENVLKRAVWITVSTWDIYSNLLYIDKMYTWTATKKDTNYAYTFNKNTWGRLMNSQCYVRCFKGLTVPQAPANTETELPWLYIVHDTTEHTYTIISYYTWESITIADSDLTIDSANTFAWWSTSPTWPANEEDWSTTQTIAPAWYHIPTKAEWDAFNKFIANNCGQDNNVNFGTYWSYLKDYLNFCSVNVYGNPYCYWACDKDSSYYNTLDWITVWGSSPIATVDYDTNPDHKRHIRLFKD